MSIEDTEAEITKKYGQGTVMCLDGGALNVARAPTGILSLDIALGGGYPKGRIIELFGPESSGKTSVTIKAMAECQAAGGVVAFIDSEHAFDPEWAVKLGADISSAKLKFSQPSYGEEALDIVEKWTVSGLIQLIVVDSVAAMTPKAELDGDMGDKHVGLQARMMSQAMRKLNAAASRTGTILIFTNQIREKIGVTFGSPETTPGGRALKFYSSCRIDVRRIQTLKNGEDAIGIRTRAKVIKNKVAPPFKAAEFDIIGERGVDTVGDIIDLATAAKIVKKSGAWFSYGESRLGQGRSNSIDTLIADQKMLKEIREKVINCPS